VTKSRSLCAAAVLTAAFCGCGAADDEAEVAALGALPPVAGHAIGPQPGPDRPLPRVDNPFAGQPNAVVEGRRLFRWFNCEGCHGGHAGGGMGPSLRDATWIYGHGEDDIYDSIAQGRAYGMPAWGTKLPSEQIWKLVAYIRSLDTSAEPDPPPQNRSYPDPPPRRDVRDVGAGG
jgi:cytochrome c oxidase cbb3-type subunit III